MRVHVTAEHTVHSAASEPFLRIPPFPGGRIARLHESAGINGQQVAVAELADLLRESRVGGTFWGPQPELPSRYILVWSEEALETSSAFAGGKPVVFWSEEPQPVVKFARDIVTGKCDPWHLLGNATALVTDTQDEIVLVAALLGVPVHSLDPANGQLHRKQVDVSDLLGRFVSSYQYSDPFTGYPMSAFKAVELCGFWRQLIDANRGIAGGLGFSFWKQDNVGTLLWGGGEPFEFFRSVADVDDRPGPVAVWRSKVSANTLAGLEERGRKLIEVEDGFLRSQGLGSDCVPPLSITVDRLGAHFDPSGPSALENLLQGGKFDQQDIQRAQDLRRAIVEAGLSKYSRGDDAIARPAGSREHVLVPGQVEDDRSVMLGGCGLSSNLELLRRVRSEAPDAYILYKPHPDVLAGHRAGSVPEEQCLQYADEIVGDESIGSLIDMVDEVHVNTSLAGFEALMRGKSVTTYGVPFYSGWGLTRDLGPVPSRRTTKRSIDELVAATLLSYPRYLDPATGLPCPPEVVVSRLIDGDVPDPSLLVSVRRLQGKVLRSVRSLVQ